MTYWNVQLYLYETSMQCTLHFASAVHEHAIKYVLAYISCAQLSCEKKFETADLILASLALKKLSPCTSVQVL